MGELEITIDGNIIQDLILGDRDEASATRCWSVSDGHGPAAASCRRWRR